MLEYCFGKDVSMTEIQVYFHIEPVMGTFNMLFNSIFYNTDESYNQTILGIVV